MENNRAASTISILLYSKTWEDSQHSDANLYVYNIYFKKMIQFFKGINCIELTSHSLESLKILIKC